MLRNSLLMVSKSKIGVLGLRGLNGQGLVTRNLQLSHQYYRLNSTSSQPQSTSNAQSQTHEQVEDKLPVKLSSPTPNAYLPTNSEAASNSNGFWAKFKTLFQFYKKGIQQVFVNRKEAKTYITLHANGENLTRRQYRLIHSSGQDVKKLVPFIFLLIILPESIPFVLVFAPQFVPSTCVTEEQMLKKRTKTQDHRNELTATALKSAVKNDKLLTAKDFGSVEKIIEVIKKYNHAFDMSLVDKEPLAGYCKFMGIPSWGPKTLLEKRVIDHFNYVRQDDEYLANEGVKDLSESELVQANEERGMRTIDQTPEQLRRALKDWVSITQFTEPRGQPILLILSRIFINNLHTKN